MKKLFALVGTGLASLGVFAADPAVTANVSNVTTLLNYLQAYIEQAMDVAWPIITAIVAVGLLVWLGRVLIRAVRSYFTTAM